MQNAPSVVPRGTTGYTGGTRYEILGTKFCYISSQQTIPNRDDYFNGTRENKFVVSDNLLYQISLYQVSTVKN